MTNKNKVDEGNWITLHRSILTHWLYRDNLYFSAWIKLLLLTNHSIDKTLIKGKLITCDRGQSARSLSTWSKEFGKGWSIQKVRTFFKLLEDDQMINIESVGVSTRLTICNYDTYQPLQHAYNTHPTRTQHASNTHLTTNNKDKKNKNEKKTPSSEPQSDSVPDDAVLTFDCNGPVKEWYLTRSKINEWSKSYVGVDVHSECLKARQWIIDNPSRRKTANGMTKFLGGWISRSVNSGRSKTQTPASLSQGGIEI